MDTKTLKVIQTLAKVGKILSKIVAVCSIVGVIGCLVGIISLAVFDIDTIKIGGVTIHGLIEKSAEMSIGTMYAAIIVGMIFCIGEAAIAKLAVKYFKNELDAGTPFTASGAKELMRLGICTICISFGVLIAVNIAFAVINKGFPNVEEMHLSDFNQVGIGVAFIITSILCKYGAELEEKN